MSIPVARASTIVQKRPSEVIKFDIELKDKLATSETLSAFAATFPLVSPAAQLTVTGALSGTQAQITATAGNAEELFTVDAAADTILVTGHTFADGDEVYFAGDNLPAPLQARKEPTAAGTAYYVRDKAADTFKVTTKKDESGDLGVAVDILSAGEGCVGHDYVVTVRCTTSNGQTVDGEAVVMVGR